MNSEKRESERDRRNLPANRLNVIVVEMREHTRRGQCFQSFLENVVISATNQKQIAKSQSVKLA